MIIMKPKKFKEQNKVLIKPDSMTNQECGSLPIYTNGEQCISCWELSDDDIMDIVKYKKIWVGVYSGENQPPIWLDTRKNVFNNE